MNRRFFVLAVAAFTAASRTASAVLPAATPRVRRRSKAPNFVTALKPLVEEASPPASPTGSKAQQEPSDAAEKARQEDALQRDLDIREAIRALRVDVTHHGALGDGASDDTAAVQAAIDAADGLGQLVWFPPGTYSVTNLVHRSTGWEGVEGKSIIKARKGGDADYLIASPSWLTPGSAFASKPTGFSRLTFDANNLKTYGVVLRTYFTRMQGCRVKNAIDTDLLESTDARDGTPLSSTMVENEFISCWFGEQGARTRYNFRTLDALGKATDHHVLDCYFKGAKETNLQVQISAGWLIRGNHLYGATESMRVYKPNLGTRIEGNYCENECRFGTPVVAGDSGVIGPGNYFRAAVWAEHNAGNVLVSESNHYEAAAELRHNYFSPAKYVVSRGDVFRATQPFVHYASGAVQNASTGRFIVQGAVLSAHSRVINASFDGSRARSTWAHRPATWDSDAFNAVRPPTNAVALSYAARVMPDVSGGGVFVLEPTDGRAFTIDAPVGGPIPGHRITVRIVNTFGRLGTAKWSAAYRLAAWVQPAAGFSRSIDFIYDGGNWVEAARTPSDIPHA